MESVVCISYAILWDANFLYVPWISCRPAYVTCLKDPYSVFNFYCIKHRVVDFVEVCKALTAFALLTLLGKKGIGTVQLVELRTDVYCWAQSVRFEGNNEPIKFYYSAHGVTRVHAYQSVCNLPVYFLSGVIFSIFAVFADEYWTFNPSNLLDGSNRNRFQYC